MRNLIGDKNSFGLEYEIQSVYYNESGGPYIMGHARLWFEGKYIGAFEDVDMLGVLLCQLKWRDNLEECQFSNMVADEIYELMVSEDVPDVCPLAPGPPFDDFVTFWYICNGKFHFIWKLVDEPFFQYPDYPKDVQTAEVSVEEYRRVVAEFGEIIESIYKKEEQEGRYVPVKRRPAEIIIIRSIRIGKRIAIIIGSSPRLIITVDDKAIGSRVLLFILLLLLLLLGLFYHM